MVSNTSESFWLGTILDSDDAKNPFYISIEDLYTHFAVLGSSGSGKTVLCKILVEEAIRKNIPVIAIDPQGDVVRLALPEEPKKLPIELQDSSFEYFEKVMPIIFTPGSEHALKVSLNPLAFFPNADDIETSTREDVNLILGGIADTILSFFPKEYLRGANRPNYRFILYKALQAAFTNSVKLRNLSDLITFLQEWDYSADLSETLYKKVNNIAEILQIVLQGPDSSLLVGGVPFNPEKLLSPINGKIPLNIFYLNVLPDIKTKQIFLANLTLILMSYMLQKGEGRFLFYIDEVRDFIPSGTKMPPSKEILKKFFTQARKYKVIGVIATQSPSSVDYEVFGQCNNRGYGRLIVQQDLKKIADFLEREHLKNLPTLKPGEFLIQTRKNEFSLIKTRRLFTSHGSPIAIQHLKYFNHPTIVEQVKALFIIPPPEQESGIAAEESETSQTPITEEEIFDLESTEIVDEAQSPSYEAEDSLLTESVTKKPSTSELITKILDVNEHKGPIDIAIGFSVLKNDLLYQRRVQPMKKEIRQLELNESLLRNLLSEAEIEKVEKNELDGYFVVFSQNNRLFALNMAKIQKTLIGVLVQVLSMPEML